MSELVRYCGHESRSLHNFVSNHCNKNPVRNGHLGSINFVAINNGQLGTLPSISTGVSGYPIEDIAKIARREGPVSMSWRASARQDMEVVFCCFSERDERLYEIIS